MPIIRQQRPISRRRVGIAPKPQRNRVRRQVPPPFKQTYAAPILVNGKVNMDRVIVFRPRHQVADAEGFVRQYQEFTYWLQENYPDRRFHTQAAVTFNNGGGEDTRSTGWRIQPPRDTHDIHIGQYHDERDVLDLAITNVEYVVEFRADAGGNSADRGNNCLLENLESFAQHSIRARPFSGYCRGTSKAKMPNDPQRFANFKHRLGLQADAPVPVSLVPEVERLLGFRIRILQGDEILYHGSTDADPATPTCVQTLVGEHYVLANTPYQFAPPKARFEPLDDLGYPRAPIVAQHTPEGVRCLGPNGEEMLTPTQVMIMERSKKISVRWVSKRADPAAELAEWKQARDELIRVSNIDLYSRGRLSDIALDSWRACNVYEPQPLPRDQEVHIRAAMMGGCVAAKPGRVENAVQIDVKSFYPYMMGSGMSHRAVPIAPGQWIDKQLHSFEDLSTESPDLWTVKLSNVPRPWRINPKNVYRESELRALLKAHPEVKWQPRDKFPVLHWEPGQCIQIGRLFKPFVEFWQEIEAKTKEAGLDNARKAVKTIRNCLWGKLCDCRPTKLYVQKDFVFDADTEFLSLRTDGERVIAETRRGSDKIFRGVLPTVGYSILSFGRVRMCSALEHLQFRGFEWRRVHTDGAVIDLKREALERLISDKRVFEEGRPGRFQVEKIGTTNVRNAMKVDWDA